MDEVADGSGFAAVREEAARVFEEALESLRAFLAIPSVSAEGRSMGEAAGFLADLARRLGAEARVVPTGGFPAVIGAFPSGGAGPTLLLYGHYDVQPADPLELWSSDPFRPELRDGVLYARGATDDKGNIAAALWGVAVARRLGLPTPRVRFLFEGEEEVGSPHLGEVLARHRAELAADACVLCDRGIHESGAAQIYLGNKGMVSVELETALAARDVHSSQAPLVPNAARRLMEAVARVASPDSELLIAEVARTARDPEPEELLAIRAIPFDADAYAAEYGLAPGELQLRPGEGAVSILTRLLFRPTANVQGFHAGYGGPGTKTIVPARAIAKLDVRLSPGMRAKEAAEGVRRALERALAAAGIAARTLVRVSADMEPYTAPLAHPAVQAAIRAGQDAYPGRPVVWPLVDGSGPLAGFARAIGGPAFIVGLGNPFGRANTHAPDENLDLEVFRRGIAMMAWYLARYVGEPQVHSDREGDGEC